MTSRLGIRWRDFLFRPTYATPMALLRIAAGVITFLWSVTILFDAGPLLFSLRSSANGDIGWWQLWPTATPVAVFALVLGLIAASGLLTVGLWTGPAAWATFLLLTIVQRYNPAALNGGDLILRSVLILGVALTASGSYLSIDSWRRHRAQRWQAPAINPWGLRFVQLHISLGYLLTVILKLKGEAWPGGFAVWHALGLSDLVRFEVPTWIAAPPLGALLGWSTLVIEASIAIGVWIPALRKWVLMAGVALHVGIAVLFEIGFFSFVMLASYLAFVPPVSDARMLLKGRFVTKVPLHARNVIS